MSELTKYIDIQILGSIKLTLDTYFTRRGTLISILYQRTVTRNIIVCKEMSSGINMKLKFFITIYTEISNGNIKCYILRMMTIMIYLNWSL